MPPELVLAEDVTSAVNSPPYDKTLMDGYAVVSSDRGRSPPGAGRNRRRQRAPPTRHARHRDAPHDRRAAPRRRRRRHPLRANRTRSTSNTVRLPAEPTRRPASTCWPWARPCSVGQRVFDRGIVLRPIEIGILAEIGHAVVHVQPRPKVAVLPTGNELVAVNERPAAGQIRNSNGPMLAAAIARAGGAAIELPVARDEPDELRATDRSRSRRRRAAPLRRRVGRQVRPRAQRARRARRRRSLPQDRAPARQAALVRREKCHADRAGARLRSAGQSGEQPRLLRALRTARDRRARRARIRRAVACHGDSVARLQIQRRPRFLPAGSNNLAAFQRRIFDPRRTQDARPTVEILPWHGSADLVTLARANGLVRLGTEPATLRAGRRSA